MRLCLNCQYPPLPFSLFTLPPIPMQGACTLWKKPMRAAVVEPDGLPEDGMLGKYTANDASLQREWQDWGDRFWSEVTWVSRFGDLRYNHWCLLPSWYLLQTDWLNISARRRNRAGKSLVEVCLTCRKLLLRRSNNLVQLAGSGCPLIRQCSDR